MTRSMRYYEKYVWSQQYPVIVLLLFSAVVTDDGKIRCDNDFGSIKILYQLEIVERCLMRLRSMKLLAVAIIRSLRT